MKVQYCSGGDPIDQKKFDMTVEEKVSWAKRNLVDYIWKSANYLKKHYKVRHINLLTSGKLTSYLTDIDK